MSVLSSRASATSDLTRMISDSGAKVLIIEDSSVDPAEIRVIQEIPGGESKTILIKSVEDGINEMDLIWVIDRLGFYVHYEERR